MLTSFADEDLVLDAISAGAAGYVLKQVGTDDLLRAVRAVGRGDAMLDPSVTRQLLARVRRAEHDAHGAAFQDLSERELAILALIAEGKTNAEIAATLFLSEKTARNHVSTILAKLDLTNDLCVDWRPRDDELGGHPGQLQRTNAGQNRQYLAGRARHAFYALWLSDALPASLAGTPA